ncbi:DUF6318 family protein [Gleimia hominis]|uniref:DUF6318 family protein n=1 Tax=Gleimia hominis TaxID=595468 RepID=A0ABU3I9I0_9ACTO|nr:DUF6318 family protein [Gleimia hominis]MDT3767025.1 DUF6318 family protein [Gleimia hominis]
MRNTVNNRKSQLAILSAILLACTPALSACSHTSANELEQKAGGEASSPPPAERYPQEKPEYPEEGREHTERGAFKVAAYFTELIGYSYSTYDTKPLEQLCSEETAKECKKIITNIDQAREKGEWYKNFDTSNTSMGITHAPEKGEIGDLVITLSPDKVKYEFHTPEQKDGKQVIKSPRINNECNLSWKTDHWVVADCKTTFVNDK